MATNERYTPWSTKLRSLFSNDGRLRPGRLLKDDIAGYLHRIKSDWTTLHHHPLLLSSLVYIFFANLFPALTFANDLYARTGMNWGPIVMFSTGLCGTVHSLLSLQPLTILSVTGPFSILAENIYKISNGSLGVAFLPFMTWTLIHTGWMLILLAMFNAYEWTMVYITSFTTEIFGLLNVIIYFHKAVQELQGAHDNLDFQSFLYAVISCCGTFLMALLLDSAEKWPPIVGSWFRTGLRRYAVAISFAFFAGISYSPELRQLEEEPLYTSRDAFRPSHPGRQRFYVEEAWTLEPVYIFCAMLPALIVTMLLFFDHEISTIMCTARRFNTHKPTGFTQPIVLLGLTTAVCGVMGIPPSNGLLPQAPLHSESLMYQIGEESVEDMATKELVQKPVQRVLEQRWTNFLQAGLILSLVAPLLQQVLGYTPISVLAGLFLFMSQQTLSSNPILGRTFWMLMPPSQLPPLPPRTRWWPIHAYTMFQIIIAIGIFILTLTRGGVAFPILVFSLIPFRLLVMKRIWSAETLKYVDSWACKSGSPEDDDEDDSDRRASRSLVADDVESLPIHQYMTTEYRRSEGAVSLTFLPLSRRPSSVSAEFNEAQPSDHSHELERGEMERRAMNLRPSQFQLC